MALDDAVPSSLAPAEACAAVGGADAPAPCAPPAEAAPRIRGDSSAPEGFLALASHELRTPLQAIALHVDMMQSRVAQSADDVPTPWLLERLDRTRALVRRANRLIEDLLAASELGSGQYELQRESFDLGQLAEEVIAANADALRWARCPHTVERRGPVVGRWDRSRIERVLENLISNAVKYAPGAPIEVSAWATGPEAFLSVRDRGPGIAERDRDLIFERFRRGSHRGDAGGSGLGLWIVRTIAEAHRGSICLESTPGAGAKFTVRLPLG